MMIGIWTTAFPDMKPLRKEHLKKD